MIGRRRGRRVLVALAVGAAAAALSGGGAAREGSAQLACPKDPSKQPIGKSYGTRGSTFCNDGATATAVVAGTKLTFSDGVCWTEKNGTFNVTIGTSILGKRRKADPPGFWLIDVKPGGFVKDSASFGKGVVAWGHTVTLKVKANRRTGTFAGTEPKLVGGKLTYVKASGSFKCKRVLRVPL